MTTKHVRVVQEGRLAYYKDRADRNYWDNHWDSLDTTSYYRKACNGHLGYLDDILTSYLPKKGRILEAGCGLGKFVLVLRQRGYAVEGVEWAPQTVAMVNARFPDLPVSTGDVCHLEEEDQAFSAYISLGVVEHREAGPQPFIEEAYRILQPTGVAIFTVPWFSPLRKVKGFLGLYAKRKPADAEFYQYAFTKREFALFLQASHFCVVHTTHINTYTGIDQECPFLEYAYMIPKCGSKIRRSIKNSKIAASLGGHMAVFVCKKVEQP